MADRSEAKAARTSQGDQRSELERSAWPEIDKGVLAILQDAGTIERFRAGDRLFGIGQDSYDWFYVLDGSIDIVDSAGDRTVVTIEAGAFLGELGMLMGQKTFLAAVARGSVEAIRVPQKRLRDLIATVPEVADTIVTAYAARRRLLIEWGEGGLVVVGDEDDPEALALRGFAERNRIPYRWVDRSDQAAMTELAAQCQLPPEGAAVVTGRNVVLAAPTIRELAEAIGIDLAADENQIYDCLIVGAGPAGLAASVYAASEGLCVAVVEDTAIGGQAGTSSRIENYLGFPRGISGGDLAYLGEVQAVKFGARIAAPRRACRLERKRDRFRVELEDGTALSARSVVLANGVSYRRLPLDRLAEFEGRGIYYAATELEARFCRGTDAVIVGGGNSAGQAAMFLSRHANCTHILVRGEGLAETMSSYLSDRIESDAKIRLRTKSEIVALEGGERLEAVVVRDNASGEETRIETRALFVMIGAAPNTDWLEGTVKLDDKGFILTGTACGSDDRGHGDFATSLPGVYAVGDIRSGSVKRVASAVGEGSVVISAVHAFLGDVTVASAADETVRDSSGTDRNDDVAAGPAHGTTA